MQDFKDRPLSAIPSKPDERDFRPAFFVAQETSKEDILIDQVPEIYDQGRFGMCVAFSCAANRESQQAKETGSKVRYSPGFIYGNRTSNDYCGEGMEPREALAHLVKEGVCKFDEMPVLGNFYTCNNHLLQYKSQLMPLAKPNNILSYVRGYSEDEVYTMLKNGMGPVVVCIAVYDNFYRTGSEGIVPDRLSNDKLHGYHAMVIVGRITKNGRRYWIINNSWSTEWGRNGQCYMPVDGKEYMEFWGITDAPPAALELKMDCPLQILPPGRVVAPIRFIAEALGGTAEWNEATRTAYFRVPPRDKAVLIEATVGGDILKIM